MRAKFMSQTAYIATAMVGANATLYLHFWLDTAFNGMQQAYLNIFCIVSMSSPSFFHTFLIFQDILDLGGGFLDPMWFGWPVGLVLLTFLLSCSVMKLRVRGFRRQGFSLK